MNHYTRILPVVAFLALGLLGFSHDLIVPKEIATKKNPVASSDAVLAKAKELYEENCLMCHGETGKGDGPMASMLKTKPKDINDAKMMSEMTDGDLYWIMTKGSKEKGMPPFDPKISEDDRWGLVHLLRSISKTKPNNTPHKGH